MATADSVKAKIQGLIDQSNATTGNTDADLTTAVGALIAGFGQGGGGNLLDYAESLNGTFSNVAFPSGTEFELSFGNKIPSLGTNAVLATFADASGLKSIKLSSSAPYAPTIGLRQAFYGPGDTTLETIDLSGMPQPILPSTIKEIIRGRAGLREVLGEFDMTNCTTVSNAFVTCPALETIRFTAGTIKLSITLASCKLLTDETVQNIIDGLADLTGGTAQTLTLHADVGAKLTEEQIASATAKNWTLSY